MTRLSVVIMTRRNDAPEGSGETKLIDWNNDSDQKWLRNHMIWAMNNGRIVSLISTAEAK